MNRELERMWPDADRRENALHMILRGIYTGKTPLHQRHRRPDLPTRCYIVAQAILRGCGSWGDKVGRTLHRRG